MRFEQLEYFIAVAKHGSFSAAAQELFVTQQAISISMRQLEEELGKPLFIKEKSKMRLTLYGEKLLEHAQHILHEKDDLLSYFQEKTKYQETMYVNICSTSCVANITLPNLITNYQAHKQKLILKIAQMESMQQVLEAVQSGEKDIGLISMNEAEFAKKFAPFQDSLQLELLARDELLGVINAQEYDGTQQEIDTSKRDRSLSTLYNIEPTDEHRMESEKSSIICSNDADFHRAMLERKGTTVTMSGLSYQYFFNHKKYVALPIKDVDVTILHIAVYRKEADANIQDFVRRVRKEMHMK